MDGSATFTIVMSRTIISIPVHNTTRAVQRERSCIGLSSHGCGGLPGPFGVVRTEAGAETQRSLPGGPGPRNVHERGPPRSTSGSADGGGDAAGARAPAFVVSSGKSGWLVIDQRLLA